MVYIFEAIVILVIAYLFYVKMQSVNLKQIKELKEKIITLKDDFSNKENKVLQSEHDTKDTSYISSEIKKREKLEQEIKRLHQTVEDTKHIAQNASMVKSDFLSNVRHEIRTPMNSILVFAELLKKEISDKKLATFADNITNSGNKLLILLESVIELSEIESGDFEIVESAVDVKNLFALNIESFKQEANKKGLELSVEIDEDVPDSLMLDPLRVNDILNNLVANAIKFTQRGFVKIMVVVDRVDETNNVVDLSISVKDSGIGIDEKNQNRIFEIFETKENCDAIEYQGSGLGLSINRKLSQLMNGTLVVQSELSRGSTFILSLKGVEVVLSSAKEKVDESKIDFSLIKPSGATILIADSSLENRELLKQSFSNTNTTVLDFDNARSAIETLKKREVDLILIDVDMLSIDEGAVSKVIKTITSVPVVTLTSTRLKDVVFQDGGVKPVGHLKKPLTKVEIFKLLLKILNSQGVVVDKDGSMTVDSTDDETNADNINFVQLKIFMHVQKSSLEGLYEEATATNDLNAINSFSNMLLELSTKYRLKDLMAFSKLLLHKIELFEIDTINLMLIEYKNKIKKYESMIKK